MVNFFKLSHVSIHRINLLFSCVKVILILLNLINSWGFNILYSNNTGYNEKPRVNLRYSDERLNAFVLRAETRQNGTLTASNQHLLSHLKRQREVRTQDREVLGE